MVIFRIGNDERPASPEDVKDVAKMIKKCRETGSDLVMHHSIDFIEINDCLLKDDIVVGTEDMEHIEIIRSKKPKTKKK